MALKSERRARGGGKSKKCHVLCRIPSTHHNAQSFKTQMEKNRFNNIMFEGIKKRQVFSNKEATDHLHRNTHFMAYYLQYA